MATGHLLRNKVTSGLAVSIISPSGFLAFPAKCHIKRFIWERLNNLRKKVTVLLKIYIHEFILKAAACSKGWVLWSLKSSYNCVGWMRERDDVASAEATIKPFRFLLEGAVSGNSGYWKACNPDTGPQQGSLRAVRARRWTAAPQKQGQVQVKWV